MNTYSRRFLMLASITLLSACANFTLGNVHPQDEVPTEQQKLDTEACTEQAKLAVSNIERKAINFITSLTIIGAPFVSETEKTKARNEFIFCMKNKGYTVDPAND